MSCARTQVSTRTSQVGEGKKGKVSHLAEPSSRGNTRDGRRRGRHIRAADVRYYFASASSYSCGSLTDSTSSFDQRSVYGCMPSSSSSSSSSSLYARLSRGFAVILRVTPLLPLIVSLSVVAQVCFVPPPPPLFGNCRLVFFFGDLFFFLSRARANAVSLSLLQLVTRDAERPFLFFS